ncbi:MAG: PaaI family thioesterase [Gammaproteobacteria bacterium]
MNLRRIIWHSPWLTDAQRIEWYPAFWLMRIRVLELSPCWRTVRILLPHSWIATNTGGSLFGGFQACLADPIAAMSCMKVFPGYSVWTRSLHLDFLHEGTTDMELRFTMPPERERQIRHELEVKGRSTPQFEYGYYLQDGRLCTVIKARIAIRPKGYKKIPNQHSKA